MKISNSIKRGNIGWAKDELIYNVNRFNGKIVSLRKGRQKEFTQMDLEAISIDENMQIFYLCGPYKSQ
jgi:hypothetical protein